MFDKAPKSTSPSPDDFFDSSIAHKEVMDIRGAKVETVSLKTENQKTNIPVMVLPGWSATYKSFEPGIKELVKRGRPVLSLNYPRKGGEIPDWYNKNIAEWYESHGKEYPKWSSEFVRQANTTLGVLEKEKIEKVDVIAHSMACPSVCIAAMMHPEKFEGRTIILTNAAGVIGKDTFIRLVKGAMGNTSRTPTMEGIPMTEGETAYLEATKNITPETVKANPLRAAKEVWDIAGSEIDENMLQYLKDKGIKIIVVGAVEDTMFPMEGMQKNVKGEIIAGFVSTMGGHMQTQVHGEKFFGALETMLPQGEEKK